MTAKTLVFLPILLAAFGFFAYNANRLISYLKLARPTDRFGDIGKRLSQMFIVAFAQKKILRDKVAGPIHAGIFWGFLILLASAVEAILEGIHEGWSLNFLGPLYSVSTILTDLFCTFIILATLAALWRRYISKIRRLQVEGEKVEAALILLTIFTIVSSLLIQNSTRVAMGTDFSWAVRPVGSIVAMALSGFSPDTLMAMHETAWWIHIVLILSFMNYLPFSKHLHVLTSVPNTFFATTHFPNDLKPINFEEEGIEKFGVVEMEDFTWKTLLDGYTCTHCGRCTSVCPANQTGKLLDPRAVIVNIHHRTMDRAPLLVGSEEERNTPEAQAILEKKLVGDYVSVEALWQCTTCGACMQECPVMIEHVPAIVDMRRSLVMMEANFPPEVQPAFTNIENNFTPWAFSASERADWAEGTGIKTVADDPEFEVLFWVGCAGSYDDRAKKITRAFAELMQIAGVNFRILGTEERCTGDPARRIGNEYLADMLVKMNVETLNMYSVKKIVTTCPHCFNTLKNEYPAFGGQYDVLHHTQFIRELTDSGKLKVDKNTISPEAVTYHDSCYMGRYNQEYEAPRASLTDIPGLNVIEVKRSKDKGFCCGAGGGQMFMEETEGKRVNIERTEELLATGASTIAVNCPFCMTMITDGVKEKEKIDEVKVKDVAEVLLEHIHRTSIN
jgi:Fe-S oxidoreductase/nitrate reductase gamma subunit